MITIKIPFHAIMQIETWTDGFIFWTERLKIIVKDCGNWIFSIFRNPKFDSKNSLFFGNQKLDFKIDV